MLIYKVALAENVFLWYSTDIEFWKTFSEINLPDLERRRKNVQAHEYAARRIGSQS